MTKCKDKLGTYFPFLFQNRSINIAQHWLHYSGEHAFNFEHGH